MAELVQHIINGLAAGTIYALVALGYTMVYGVLKLINFAHGDVMMVGVYTGYATATNMGRENNSTFLGVTFVFLVAMGLCAGIGFCIERFAYRPLREKPRLVALITAIGVSFTISYGFQLETHVGGVTVLPGAAPKAFPEIIKPTEWLIFGDRDVVVWNWQVISVAIAVALMVALQYLVFKTRFGVAMRAVSFDHKTSALMGIPVDRIIALTFMLGSALAAGAGILYAIKDTLVQPLMGAQIGLKAFVAAVIGGIGHVPGAVVGAILLGLVEEMVVGYGSSTWRDAVAFGFLIVVLLFKPEGLFGKMTAEKSMSPPPPPPQPPTLVKLDCTKLGGAGALDGQSAVDARGSRSFSVVVALLGVGALACASCGEPTGSEGGACTAGGACDPGLSCLSSLCVRVVGGEGEGEGEGGEGEGAACSGDDGGAHAVGECANIPAAACAPIDQNETETTCRDSALTLRAGIFDAVFPCLADISSADCHTESLISACFDAVTACSNDGAQTTCQQASDACVQGGDDGFPLETCVSDLTPTNFAFRTAWADCFNNDTGACSDVENNCYNVATNTVITQTGG